ncbi:hypothetical protein [Jeongeupia naejangsanensis]|uniref:Type II secretion system protein G n=1 Tax=Jeongeupia naejangsanensis TaxID=613195 RepID=A0ABS2BKK4_9NEIS|nr:hypothetical protein [Jeongeupia naejangsanensis]MBM3116145.1 hypothetical protein [Jeongeupia naejangsanensis]
MRWLIVLTTLATILLVFWASPLNPLQNAPGEGEASTKAYKNLAIVIQALEKYKGEKGSYPNELGLLTPQYLAKLPDISNERHNTKLDYSSKNQGREYELEFSYHDPGTNSCVYSFPDGWSCTGAY